MKLFIVLTSLLVLVSCSKDLVKYHGRTYKVIEVDGQLWMAGNLASDSYRYGRKIHFVESGSEWKDIYSPACCFYNNDSAMLEKYGMLYNWYAVDAGNLCPAGWRVASHDDWNKLEKTLGGNRIAGGRMKAESGWKTKHVSGDDIGFKALPGGYRLNEDFEEGYTAIWWTSTNVDENWVWGRRIDFDSSELKSTFNNRQNGFSVRCVRNIKNK